MAYNGSGTFVLYSPGNPTVTGTTISSTWANNTLTDIASGLSTAITKDGQTTVMANIPMAAFKFTGLGAGSSAGDSLRYEQQFSVGANIASASTINLSTATGQLIHITGTTTIAAVTLTAGLWRTVIFDGILTLTHDATANNLPGGANITTAAGDRALYWADGTTVYCVAYQKASGLPVSTVGLAASGANADITSATALVSAAGLGHINEFRLSLTSGVPVTTSDVGSGSTVYAVPYVGNRIALYDGAAWNVRSSAEFSLALGTLTAGRPYDVFCYDNAGTPTLEFLAWTSGTARATALAYQDGVLCKTGALTRRYLGTFYTNSTTTTLDTLAGRYLWNYYNRVSRKMSRYETGNWTYTTATYRQANGSASNQLNFVIGVSEDLVTASVITGYSNTSINVTAVVHLGLDSTTSPATDSKTNSSLSQTYAANALIPAMAQFSGYSGIGIHYISWLEYSAATGTTTFYGNGFGLTGELQG